MDLLVEFLRHNTMMNGRLLESCRPLSPDQLGATVEGTYGSVGATLVHIANAQVFYAARLLDTPWPERLPEEPFPGFEALAARLDEGDERLEHAAARDSGGREVEVSGDDPPGKWRMPVALILLQAVNHGTEHRAQIATILTQIGVTPPEMDGWTYFSMAGHMLPV